MKGKEGLRRFRLRLGLAALFLALAVLDLGLASRPAVALQGEYSAHDPSRIVRDHGKDWVFVTGPLLPTRSSTDGVHWQAGPSVFKEKLPDWVLQYVPDKPDLDVWAPDLVFERGRFCLYYTVSVFGRNESAIGLATNPTLDPADPRYHWTDEGPVIVTAQKPDPARHFRGNWDRYDPALRNDTYNALDPGPVLDGEGNPWLVFGSYWTGIKLIPLDPATGRRRPGDTRIYPVADYGGDVNHAHAIEAAYLARHDGYYYLFVNWDYCCRGVNSTYNIRVGRSRRITGPYLDEAGTGMLKGGGTLFLGNSGREIGSGHAGLFDAPGGDTWVSYHYYDALDRGRPKLGLRHLVWTRDGWPVAGTTVGDPAS